MPTSLPDLFVKLADPFDNMEFVVNDNQVLVQHLSRATTIFGAQHVARGVLGALIASAGNGDKFLMHSQFKDGHIPHDIVTMIFKPETVHPLVAISFTDKPLPDGVTLWNVGVDKLVQSKFPGKRIKMYNFDRSVRGRIDMNDKFEETGQELKTMSGQAAFQGPITTNVDLGVVSGT